MPGDQYREIVIATREKYRKIGSIWCPPISASVIFDHHGLRHLLANGRGRRSFSDLAQRLKLIDHAEEVLSSAATIAEYRSFFKGNAIVQYWSVEKVIEGKRLRCVIRSIGDGRKHFFSVMKVG
jgi:hypothetical protein